MKTGEVSKQRGWSFPSRLGARLQLPAGGTAKPERTALFLLLMLPIFLLAPLQAQPESDDRPQPPPYYAIQHARIVPVSGPLLERGTVVIADGLIAAVGSDVPIPPEAWVIDGEGLTVYPGLIDSLTDLGLPEASERTRAASRRSSESAVSRGPEDRPGTTPWEAAADRLDPGDRRFEEWRKAGFTTVLTSPQPGIFPGQAALVNLGGNPAGRMVLQTPVALRVNFTPQREFRSFPASLMGVLAYIKQLYLDARQYEEAWQLYERDPSGRPRPEYDRTLETLSRARAEQWRVLLPGVWAKGILRAVRLGEQIGANTLLYGAHQGYAVAEVLAAKRIPVLVSVKWPERSKEADPEAEEPLRVLEFRDRAPSTPAALHHAGVPFAFYSDGMANPREVLKQIGKAVQAGLPAEAALRALTLGAAEIFGVSNRIGSVEVGKIANLVVTEGDLFQEETKVKMVFVDGRMYKVREPAWAKGSSTPREAAASPSRQQPAPAPGSTRNDSTPGGRR